jgi:hypothetical protein
MNLPSPAERDLGQVLAYIARHPVSALLLHWNWKSAVMSAAFRAPVFFTASVRYGLKVAITGAALEAGFNAIGAGFYGAFLQAVRNAQPFWLAWLVSTCAVPACIQIAVNLAHRAAGTSNLRHGITISLALSAITASFNLYSMRRGVMLTGSSGKPFLNDLGRLPGVIFSFLMTVPRWVMRRVRGDKSP